MRTFFRLFIALVCISITGVVIGLSGFLLERYYAPKAQGDKKVATVTPTLIPTPTAIPFTVSEISSALLLQQSSMSAEIAFLEYIATTISAYERKKDEITVNNLSFLQAKNLISQAFENRVTDIEVIREMITEDTVLSKEQKVLLLNEIISYTKLLDLSYDRLLFAKTTSEIESIVTDLESAYIYSYGILRIFYMYELLHIQSKLSDTRSIMNRVEKTIENLDGDLEQAQNFFDDVMIRLESLEVAVKKNYEEIKALTSDDPYKSVFARIREDRGLIAEELSAIRLDISRLRMVFSSG